MFLQCLFLQCFDAVGWAACRKGTRPVKIEWWGAGVVICLERDADLHMAQLMPLPLTVSCFSKIQIGCPFLLPAHLGNPGKGPLNGCVYVWLISPQRRMLETSNFVHELTMWSLSLVVSECSLSGRGQGQVSNFYIMDLENFATASRRYTGDIHNSSVVGLFMTPIRQWMRLERITVECTCVLHIGPP